MTKGRANRQKTVSEQIRTKRQSIQVGRQPKISPPPASASWKPSRKGR